MEYRKRGFFGFNFDGNSFNTIINKTVDAPEIGVGLYSTTPVVDLINEQIYVSAHRDGLLAFDLNGNLLWNFLGANTLYESSPVLGPDGTVYIIGSNENNAIESYLYAIFPDGTEKWSLVISTVESLANSYNGRYGIALSNNGKLYFSTSKGYLYSVDSFSGLIDWQFTLIAEGTSGNTPIIDINGNIFFNDLSGLVMSLDSMGNIIWSKELVSSIESSPAIWSDGKLYVNTVNNFLYAFGPIIPIADIETQIEVISDNVSINDGVFITITVENLGPDTASSINTEFKIPDGFVFDSTSNPNSYLDPLTNTVHLITNLLEANSIDSTFIVINPFIEGFYDLTATSTSETLDNNLDNNVATINIKVNPVSEIETKITSPDTTILINDMIDLKISNINNGPNIANNVKTLVEIPEGFEYISSDNLDAKYDPVTRIVTIIIDQLDIFDPIENNEQIITITLKAIETGIKTVNTNSTSDNFDPIEENNKATININVNPVTDMKTEIKTNNKNPLINEFVNITVNNSNLGPSNGTNIQTIIKISEGLNFISTNNSNATYNQETNTITWTTEQLENSTNQIINIILQSIEEGTQRITSITTNNNQDPSLNNNETFISLEIKDVEELVENQTNETNNNNTQANEISTSNNNTGNNKTIHIEHINANKTKILLKEAGMPVGILAILLIVGTILRSKK